MPANTVVKRQESLALAGPNLQLPRVLRTQVGKQPVPAFILKKLTSIKDSPMSSNSIFVIKPYIWEELWVFDDPDTDLVREPFVGGADTMLSMAVEQAGILDPELGFLLFFSDQIFPNADITLNWIREDFGGNVYRWDEVTLEGWLCPALLKYFLQPPDVLYAHVRGIAHSK